MKVRKVRIAAPYESMKAHENERSLNKVEIFYDCSGTKSKIK